MGTKIIHLDEYFPTGEATVQPVLLWANGRPCYEGITKHASVSQDFFKTITPVPGHSIVYVLALGSWEYYGENRNGDSFPESPYMENANPAWIAPKDTLINNYKTFEQFGYNYRHHNNKDPRKAVGKVMKAFWNPTMHRVELLIDLEDSKAPDLAERIAAGEYPPVSMGTKVPYDVCSICGNRAPTRKQYCDHLKFQMKDLINGKKVSALNPSPKFFDISWVFKPADRTAFMLKKVAEATPYELVTGAAAGEYLDSIQEIKQAAHKLAVIDKIIQGLPVDAKSSGMPEDEFSQLCKMRGMALEAGDNTPDLPEEVLRALSTKPLPSVISTSAAYGGMHLSTPEMTKIISYKTMPQIKISSDVLDRMVAMQQGVLGLLEDYPQIVESIQKTGALEMGPEHVDADIVKWLQPYVEKRAGIGSYLSRRFVPEAYRNEEKRTANLNITDPVSGARYTTTTGAALRGHDEVTKRNIYKGLGGAALLGGAYGLLHMGIGANKTLAPFKNILRPAAAVGLAGIGWAARPTMGRHYMTDEGVPIPTITELTKRSSDMTNLGSSVAIPALGTLGLMAALSHDYKSRLKSQVPIGYEGLPLSRRIVDHAGEFTTNHPVAAGLIGTGAGVALARTGPGKYLGNAAGNFVAKAVPKVKDVVKNFMSGTKLSYYLEDCVSAPSSTVVLPEVDLEKVAEWLGKVILEG